MRRVFRLISAVNPNLMSKELTDIINGVERKKDFPQDEVASLGSCGEPETVMWVDLNIDGISLYAGGKAPQAVPITCRLYGIGNKPEEPKPQIVVPLDMGFVSMVGMYHGKGKPTLETFLEPLLTELRNLYPVNSPMVNGRKRMFSVRVRALIADQAERPNLKGTYE